jgi:hypothetical protein
MAEKFLNKGLVDLFIDTTHRFNPGATFTNDYAGKAFQNNIRARKKFD